MINGYEHALMTYTHPTLANPRGQPMLDIKIKIEFFQVEQSCSVDISLPYSSLNTLVLRARVIPNIHAYGYPTMSTSYMCPQN
jgi:hypothetical protein